MGPFLCCCFHDRHPGDGCIQVVAVLNPIAGEKMQVDLEDRIASLQGELDKAHSQVPQAPQALPLT